MELDYSIWLTGICENGHPFLDRNDNTEWSIQVPIPALRTFLRSRCLARCKDWKTWKRLSFFPALDQLASLN